MYPKLKNEDGLTRPPRSFDEINANAGGAHLQSWSHDDEEYLRAVKHSTQYIFFNNSRTTKPANLDLIKIF